MKRPLLFALALVGIHCGHVASIDDRACPCVAGYTCCSGTCVAGSTCPSGTSPSGDGADGQASTPPAPGSYAPPCPNSPPAEGTPCGDETDELCVYGPYVQDDCNTKYRCGGGDPRFGTKNTWYIDKHDDAGCARYNYAPMEAASCPSTYAAVPRGQPCDAYDDDSSASVYCSYPEGLCGCTEGPGGGGPFHAFEWVCAPPPDGCPVHPPHSGEACTPLSQNCDYGSCVMSQDVPVFTCLSIGWSRVKPTKSCI
jgi:hypothetical protein